jgi:hypothetical protein
MQESIPPKKKEEPTFYPAWEFLEDKEIESFIYDIEESFSVFSSKEEKIKALSRADGKWKALYRACSQEAKATGNNSRLLLLMKAVKRLRNISTMGGFDMGRDVVDDLIQTAADTLRNNHNKLWKSVSDEAYYS